MKHFLLFGFLLLPFFGFGQVVDTAAVRREVDSLIQVLRVLTGKGEYDKALEVNAVAEKLALEHFGRESAAYGSCCSNRGRVNHIKGNFSEAEKWYLQAKEIQEKALGKEHPDYAMNLNNLADLYWDMGKYTLAEDFYIEVIDSWKVINGEENVNYLSSLYNLALLYSELEYYEKSEPIFLQVKSTIEKTLMKSHKMYGYCLSALGKIYDFKGDYTKAERMYLEALSLSNDLKSKSHPDYLRAIKNISLFYFNNGEALKAEPYFIEIKNLRFEINGSTHPYYALSLSNLAFLYHNMNNIEKAEKYYVESNKIWEQNPNIMEQHYALNMKNLADLYSEIGEKTKSEQYYSESEKIFTKLTSSVEDPGYFENMLHLADIFYEKNEMNRLEISCLKAIQFVYDKYGPEYSRYLETLYNSSCLLYSKVSQEKIISNLLEISNLSRKIYKRMAAYSSEREMLQISKKFQRYQASILSLSLAHFSNNLHASACDNALFLNNSLLDAVIARENYIARADSTTQALNAELKSCHFHLSKWYQKAINERDLVLISDLEAHIEQYEKELAWRSQDYMEYRREVHWFQICSILKVDEVAIEFVYFQKNFPHPTDSTMYAALVLLPTDTAPHFIPLCEQRQLDALIPERKGPMNNYLQNLYAFSPANNRASLYQLLWEPLERIFKEKGVKTVYYSPSGLLHRLNLAAIAPDKSGQTLADRYRLVPMGSTRQLVIGSVSRNVQITDALVYGGIRYDMDSTAIAHNNAMRGASAQDTTGGLFRYFDRSGARGDKWDYLPGTEKEANYVHELLTRQGIQSTRWRGYEATEESFKQIGQPLQGDKKPSPRLLHIATHGFFFPDPKDTTRRRTSYGDDAPVFKISEHPLIRSGLVLAGANYAWKEGRPLPGGHEDGILTAHEVSQMNLSNTELVVLSACETGLGDIKGNEGVYGLQRAFCIAGAKNVLMSLWKVPDEATEKLMTQFYKNWLEEKMPLRDSFEAAQKWLRGQKEYENPYYWAGFVLIGE